MGSGLNFPLFTFPVRLKNIRDGYSRLFKKEKEKKIQISGKLRPDPNLFLDRFFSTA